MSADEWQKSVSIIKQYLELPNVPTDMGRLFTNDFLPK
jgi:hypothetical protein